MIIGTSGYQLEKGLCLSPILSTNLPKRSCWIRAEGMEGAFASCPPKAAGMVPHQGRDYITSKGKRDQTPPAFTGKAATLGPIPCCTPRPHQNHILRPSQGRRLLRGGRELATVLAAAACLPAWQLSQSPTPSGAGGVWRREQVEFSSSPLQNDQVRALQCARIQFQDRNFYPLLSPLICGLCKGLEPIVCTLETKEPLAIGPTAREQQHRMYVFFLGSNTEPRILMNNS